MKRSKVLFSVTMLAVVGIILGACGSSGSSSKDETTVDVFNIKVETKDQLDDLAKKYEKSHEGVKINVTTVGGGQDANAALQTKFSSGDEPSIFLLGGLADMEKWSDSLADLTDTKLAKNAIEGTLAGASKDGKVYGLPMNIEGFGFLVNKELFKKAGVDIEKITSYTDFENAVKKLDSKKDSLDMKAVFGFSAKEFWVVSQYSTHFISPEFNDDLQKVYDAKTIDFKYGDVFKKYTDLINQYNVQPILSLDYSTSVEEDFANNQVAIVHQGNWIVPTLNSLDPEFTKDKLGILPLYVADSNKGKIAAGPSWYWGVNKNKDEKVLQASKDFLEWMYTDKEAMKVVTDEMEYIPAYTNFSADSISDPTSKEIFNYLSEGNVVPWMHNQYPDGYSQTQFYPEFQKYLNNDISWDELMTKSKDAWASDRK
ncbi:ABC transporter substrate-binding protein [Enterococcus rivorum]|uniref:ABC transporter substrate-binding protein n=1 Tax=Enterococcus rivorum TaxID=762845 RepID=A0A1E5KYJ1_9ENTE|nr:ABC transporter substrate-binding protein [Enterococcus rivorum]MBP2099611.1 raffinose/stachyose/melibiose transport system substrate-binding protein [Enterococcus rivorum]OEH82749.1 ABC transporter substrate-binding protein [Enterococcus rivorum]